MNVFCAIVNVPTSQSRLKTQPVYQVSSPGLLVGTFATNAACTYFARLARACKHNDVIYMKDDDLFYFTVHYHPENARILILACSILYSTTVSISSPVHCPPIWLRPYDDLLRRTVFPDMSPHPTGSFICVSLSNFARTKACTTSKQYPLNSLSFATAARILTGTLNGSWRERLKSANVLNLVKCLRHKSIV